jgi:hypothetical protein
MVRVLPTARTRNAQMRAGVECACRLLEHGAADVIIREPTLNTT